MNRVLCCLLAVAVLFVVVESLTCSTCQAAVLGKCLIPANITCSVAQSNCFAGEAVFSGIPNFIGFKRFGCLDTASCNRTVTGTILGISYDSTFHCCSTDLCVPGGASTVQLSLTAGAALLLSLWNSVGC